MAIETDEARSPGWWLKRLAKKLEARQARLQLLDSYMRGDPPLPVGASGHRDAYQQFQKKARTNFAQLTVEKPRQRMHLDGIMTAAGGDDNGDTVARTIWDGNGLAVEEAEVYDAMLGLGDGYVMIGGVDPDTEVPVITAESPMQVVTVHDPVQQRKVRAGLKLFHDADEERDLAYLHLPGRVYVAERDRRSNGAPIRFSASSWNWAADRGGIEGEPVPGGLVPIVRFRNKNGVGQFEPHVDLLDRINHQILQRMVIATMQAFRQRALKNAPEEDEEGNVIDYDALLVADPGAVWLLPEAVELWESGQVDLTPILSAVKDDVHHLAAVTSTPLHIFSPDTATQSAEGASLLREELVFMVEDRLTRAGEGWKDVYQQAFIRMGDEERAARGAMKCLWASPERRSLAERADAASKAGDIPWKTRMTYVWGFKESDLPRLEAERAADVMLTAPVVAGAEEIGAPALAPDQVKEAADAMGVLIRAGVDPEDAAQQVGLAGLKFTGAVPTSLRLPAADANQLEGA